MDMLVSNKAQFSPRDVVAIKFANGEEILASFVSIDATTITVTQPVIMQLVPMGGQATVQFAPYMLGVKDDDTYTIYLDKLQVQPMMARSDASTQYMKATSSIQLVDSNIKL